MKSWWIERWALGCRTRWTKIDMSKQHYNTLLVHSPQQEKDYVLLEDILDVKRGQARRSGCLSFGGSIQSAEIGRDGGRRLVLGHTRQPREKIHDRSRVLITASWGAFLPGYATRWARSGKHFQGSYYKPKLLSGWSYHRFIMISDHRSIFIGRFWISFKQLAHQQHMILSGLGSLGESVGGVGTRDSGLGTRCRGEKIWVILFISGLIRGFVNAY